MEFSSARNQLDRCGHICVCVIARLGGTRRTRICGGRAIRLGGVRFSDLGNLSSTESDMGSFYCRPQTMAK